MPPKVAVGEAVTMLSTSLMMPVDSIGVQAVGAPVVLRRRRKAGKRAQMQNWPRESRTKEIRHDDNSSFANWCQLRGRQRGCRRSDPGPLAEEKFRPCRGDAYTNQSMLRTVVLG